MKEEAELDLALLDMISKLVFGDRIVANDLTELLPGKSIEERCVVVIASLLMLFKSKAISHQNTCQ